MSKRTNLMGVKGDSRAKGWDPDEIIGGMEKIPTQSNPNGLGTLGEVPDTAGSNNEMRGQAGEMPPKSHHTRNANPFPGMPGAA